jgi:hypothetical protein
MFLRHLSSLYRLEVILSDAFDSEHTSYLDAAVSNGKWKPRRFSLVRLPFAHCANGNLSFVGLLRKKQTKVTFANILNVLIGLAHLWSLPLSFPSVYFPRLSSYDSPLCLNSISLLCSSLFLSSALSLHVWSCVSFLCLFPLSLSCPFCLFLCLYLFISCLSLCISRSI